MVNDTLSDLIIRLKNAQAAGRSQLEVPYANTSRALVELLIREGYLASLEDVTGKDGHRALIINFRAENPLPFRLLRRVSTPGHRQYAGYRDVKRPLSGYGLAVISTPKGMLTDRQAKREHVGGEVICVVA